MENYEHENYEHGTVIENVSSFLSELTSFLAFLGALLVVLAFKCDAKVLLQVTRD